ncbi:SMI1/KNR4 family protein [Pseudomonas sp. NPDC090202]|uniref:SMI1/KNR4 family protein n=1 Tax=unclassified Pseudomonas TaxID=196821 RepID=UPI00382C43BA
MADRAHLIAVTDALNQTTKSSVEQNMIDIKDMEVKYVSIFGAESCGDGEVARVEAALDITLPSDLKEIAKFYSGGFLGGISHYEIAVAGEAKNIVQQTLKVRAAIGLERNFVILAEPAGSIIVLNVLGNPSVIWCDAVDAENLNSKKFANAPDEWGTYSSFFSYLLDQQEENS